MTDDSSARVAEIAAWAREIGSIDASRTVVVVERACSRPGWPPFEVAISYETADGRHERIVHKRLERVTRLDVAGAWRGPDACCG